MIYQFFNADIQNAKIIKNIFDSIKLYAGLQINENKIKIYFSKACNSKREILNVLMFQQSELPIKYLRLPLSCSQIKDSDCAKLHDIILSKLDNWSSKLLKIAGRVELIYTAIIAVIMYWMPSHSIPVKTMKRNRRIMCKLHLE